MALGLSGYRLAILIALAAASPAHAQAPHIRGFTPDSGSTGTLVKIIGEHLDAVTAVLFGGVASPTVSHVSNLHLKAVVPEGAMTGPIGLVDRDGLHTYTLRPFEVWTPTPPRPPLALAVPSPSPAFGSVTLGFSLSTPGRARLSISDLQGRLVRLLVDADLDYGPHVRVWDGRDDRGLRVASGLFFVQLQAEGKHLVRRIILVG